MPFSKDLSVCSGLIIGLIIGLLSPSNPEFNICDSFSTSKLWSRAETFFKAEDTILKSPLNSDTTAVIRCAVDSTSTLCVYGLYRTPKGLCMLSANRLKIFYLFLSNLSKFQKTIRTSFGLWLLRKSRCSSMRSDRRWWYILHDKSILGQNVLFYRL